MSLKAKLEAVIYAAEEPVTLAQLAVLFAGEALEWKAARDAEEAPALPLPEEAAAEAAAESLASPAEPADAPEAIAESSPEAETSAAVPGAVIELVAESIVAKSTEDAPQEAPVPAEPSAEESNVEESNDTDAPDRLPESVVDSPEVQDKSEKGAEDEAAIATEARVETPSIVPFESPAADSEPDAAAEAADSEGIADSQAIATEVAPIPVDPNSEMARALSAEEAEFEARRQERRRDREARETLRSILDELIAEYASDARGIEIREIAGGYRMGTKPEMHDAVRAFVKSLKPPLKLSLPALETLAVIAYKQPVTAPEVGEIRGVDSAGVLGSLMSRKLIATAGRKQVVGRPMLYKTTKEFLLRFGLKDVNELPSMEEFEKMAAQELSEEIGDESAAQTGDLFAESETATVPEGAELSEESGEEPEAVRITETSEPGTAESETAEPETAESEAAETESSEPESTGVAHESVQESAPESTEAEASQTNEQQATGATPDAEEIEVQS